MVVPLSLASQHRLAGKLPELTSDTLNSPGLKAGPRNCSVGISESWPGLIKGGYCEWGHLARTKCWNDISGKVWLFWQKLC